MYVSLLIQLQQSKQNFHIDISSSYDVRSNITYPGFTCGYGEKYQGRILYLPSSIISTFFIRVTTSS